MNLSKLIVLFAISLCISGCYSVPTIADCAITAEELVTLKKDSLVFLESKGIDTKCEVFSNEPEIVGKYGCGLYGNATNGAKNPRTGQDCPLYLDGGYWVTFDHETLKTKQMVLVSW